MLTQDDARRRVAKGAAHLDRYRPDWFNDIDTGTLTMQRSCLCIMGQLGRGIWVRARVPYGDELRPSVSLDSIGTQTWATYDERHADYQVLQDAWIEAIADRRLRETTGVTDDSRTIAAVATTSKEGKAAQFA